MVEDDELAHLRGIARLKKLGLQDTCISDEALLHIANLPSLESLNLTGTAVTGKGLRRLTSLPSLQRFELANCPDIHDKDLAHLHGLKTLRHLTILDSVVTAGGIRALCAANPAVNVEYKWSFSLEEENNQAVMKMDGVKVVFAGAVLRFSAKGSVRISGNQSGSSGLMTGSGSLVSEYQDGEARIRFSTKLPAAAGGAADYEFRIKKIGAVFACGKQEFDISDGETTIHLSTNGVGRIER